MSIFKWLRSLGSSGDSLGMTEVAGEKKNTQRALIFLHIIFVGIILVNFPVGKYFLGWDSVNPEFNFALNFKRAFTAMWQENYGLGTMTGHGFAATLPHTIITFILSIVLPQWAIRTTFTFLCLYVGTIGMYFFVRMLLNKVTKHIEFIAETIDFIAVAAALYYAFNLGTLQIFYVQLEAFIIHFAMLPWAFWILIKALQKPTRKNLLLFLCINFILSGQGFIPSLFVTYFLALCIFLGTYIVNKRFSVQSFKKASLLLFLTLAINAYWLTPLVVYQKTHSSDFLQAYNNITSTNDFVAKNQKYGTVAQVALLKGFYLDTPDIKAGLAFAPLINHYANPIITIFGYILFAISLFGVMYCLLKPAFLSWVGIGFAGIYIVFFTNLATNTPPFSFIISFLQFFIPGFKQAFRSPFTKFGIGMGFLYAVFFAIGLYVIFYLVYKQWQNKKLVLQLYGVSIVALLLIGLPLLTGNLFYKKLLVDLPSSYKQIIADFKTRGDGRIADFPQDCPEGWYGYNWGYFGSGFYWYGIKQPIMSRTFDVWSTHNENYYWEISHAIQSGNMDDFDTVIKKYDIKWLLFDPNFQHCQNQKNFFRQEELFDYIASSPHFKLVKTYTDSVVAPISLYEYTDTYSNSYVSIAKGTLQNVGPQIGYADSDSAFKNGLYMTTETQPVDTFYPYRSLFTKRTGITSQYHIKLTNNSIQFDTTIPENNKDDNGYVLRLPAYNAVEKSLSARLNFVRSNSEVIDAQIYIALPQINIDDTRVFPNNALADAPIETIKIGGAVSKIVVNGAIYMIAPDQSELNIMLSTKEPNSVIFYDEHDVEVSSWTKSTEQLLGGILTTPIEIPLDAAMWGKKLTITVPKVFDNKTYGITRFGPDLEATIPQPCNVEFAAGTRFQFLNKEDDSYYRIFSKNNKQCLTYHLDTLETSLSYLIEMRSKYTSGLPSIFRATNSNNAHFLEVPLGRNNKMQTNFFILPGQNPYDLGYKIEFENYSLNNNESINDFGGFAMWAFPYQFIKETSFTKVLSQLDDVNESTAHKPQHVVHPNELTYIVGLDQSDSMANSTLILEQEYHEGWKAYLLDDGNEKLDPPAGGGSWKSMFPFLFGKELKQHILINNWANGWEIPPLASSVQHQIVIVFWPQYLQWIGFGLLFISLVVILLV